jgi:Flp pilus assembly protein TadG
MTLSARTHSARTLSARFPQRLAPGTENRESGSAVADFAMVSGLLSLLFLAVFQLGLALHIRNTLISCASEGARFGAHADATPQDGVARASQMIRASLADRYADNVTAMTTTVDGVQVVQIRVQAPLPVLGTLGPDRVLSVQARAFSENQ